MILFSIFCTVEFVDESMILQLFAVRDEAWLKEEEARVRRAIKEGLKPEEASRKSEVGNKRDDHVKKDKYVVPARRRIMS